MQTYFGAIKVGKSVFVLDQISNVNPAVNTILTYSTLEPKLLL